MSKDELTGDLQMDKIQFKAIKLLYPDGSIDARDNITNLCEEDEFGFVEFDCTFDLSHTLKDTKPVSNHIRTQAKIIEYIK